jgi:hypothetical protein
MAMGSRHHEYNLLCKDLFNTNFRWFIPNDINREFEGKNLREKFCDDSSFRIDDLGLGFEANILEVFLAISMRCEWIVMDEVNNLDVCYWFKELLHNLELDLYTDEAHNNCAGNTKIDLILDRFMNRTYSKNGTGGLFPLKFSNKNQRKVEIWYQMNLYLVENYYVE